MLPITPARSVTGHLILEQCDNLGCHHLSLALQPSFQWFQTCADIQSWSDGSQVKKLSMWRPVG